MIPSSIPRPAPSTNLLRFLRSQSDNCCFFPSGVTTTLSKRAARSHSTSCRNPGYLTSDTGRWQSTARPSSSGIGTERSLSIRQRGPPYVPRRPSPFCHGVERTLSNQHIRYFSATPGKTRHFFRRLFGRRPIDPRTQLKPDDLPGSNGSLVEDGQEANPFTLGRHRALKAANEPRLRCTEFDEIGNVTLVSEEFRKSELIAKYGLLPRDLRKIDSSVLPHMLVRQSSILLSLLHLRVLIKADRVLVFDAYGSADSYTQSLFMYDLEGKLRQRESSSRTTLSQSSLPYEFRALEAVLVSVTTGLEAEFEGVREPVVRVLRALEEDIDRDKLRHLLIYSKRLGTFEQKARLVRDAIEDLLEADDDLSAMYLSEKSKGVQREEQNHQEVEMLLESYHKVCDEIVQASSNLVTSIRNTEEVIKAILDANRNSLMLLDLKVSIGTLGLAVGTLLSALYGMNLKNFIEESDLGFASVTGVCFTASAFVCMYGLLKLRKVQRVRMWGEGGIQDPYAGRLGNRCGPPLATRGNWRSDSLDPSWMNLPVEGRAQRLRRARGGAASPAATASSGAKGQAKQGAKKASSQQKTPKSQPRTAEGDKEAQKGKDLDADSDPYEEIAAGNAAYGSSR